ncbi:hypothetical protein Pan216_21390 [Planctomycetes bacterium Pan216]|uniref:Uncharacterized protein n=1 Tax=Kolteria novifilia TaxID=2527975 RepID=A0A518B2X0_9BACT|nr:hypothetical protein Pan216_21390 [Planctomycetes bacterium Pan216]
MASEIEAIEMAELPYGADFSAPSRRIVSAGSVTIASLPGVTPLDSPIISLQAPGIEGLTGGGIEASASEYISLVAGEGCGIQLLDAADATGEVTIEFPSDGLLTIQSQDFNQMILMEAAGIQVLTPETITMTTGDATIELDSVTGFEVDCFGISNLLLDEAGAQLECSSSYVLVSEVLITMESSTVDIIGETTITGGLIVA